MVWLSIGGQPNPKGSVSKCRSCRERQLSTTFCYSGKGAALRRAALCRFSVPLLLNPHLSRFITPKR
jgi:hypothetical protein